MSSLCFWISVAYSIVPDREFTYGCESHGDELVRHLLDLLSLRLADALDLDELLHCREGHRLHSVVTSLLQFFDI